MGASLRFRSYIKREINGEETLFRLPQRYRDGNSKFPILAGQTVKSVEVEIDGDQISRMNGSYLVFDANGGWDRRASVVHIAARLDADYLTRSVKQMKIADLATARRARELANKHKWLLTEADYRVIFDDLGPATKNKIPILHG